MLVLRQQTSLFLKVNNAGRRLSALVKVAPAADTAGNRGLISEHESKSFRLQALGRSELLYLLDQVSRAGESDPKVWIAYSKRAQTALASFSVQDLCAVVRALCRVAFPKRSLLNQISKRLRAEASELTPRQLSQVLNDLSRLGHLDGPLLLGLLGTDSLGTRLEQFLTFDLCLLLMAFERASVRDEEKIKLVGQTLVSRDISELTRHVVIHAFYALALLDCGNDGTAWALATNVLPRFLTKASQQELVNTAFALVTLDLPCAELLSFVLDRIARQASALNGVEAHAMRVVEHCIRLPAALHPAMHESLTKDAVVQDRCRVALEVVLAKTSGVEVEFGTTSSKLQRGLERYFAELHLPFRSEEVVGPYVVDYALPAQTAIEVDGYKHYYAFSQRLIAKGQLKLRILHSLGWRVVSLPHFDWLTRSKEERLIYVSDGIEAATGTSLSALRRASFAGSVSSKKSSDAKLSQKRNSSQATQLPGRATVRFHC